MSRHQLTPKRRKKHCTIVIGWDRPLGTYYAHVHSHHEETPAARSKIGRIWAAVRDWTRTLAVNPHRHIDDFVMVGMDYGEITDPAAAIAHVAPYAIIPPDLHNILSEDAAREGSRRADRNRNSPHTHLYND